MTTADDRLQFDYFDRMTPEYAVNRLAFGRRLIEDDPKASLRVLDVGCGDGAVLSFLTAGRSGCEAVGIDPASRYVEKACERGVAATVGSVLDEPVMRRLGRYDYVVLASVLHHLVGPTWRASRRYSESALNNCLDALGPDGRLLIYESCFAPRLVNRLGFAIKSIIVRLGRNRRIDIGWVNIGAPLVAFFEFDELVRAVERAGGRIETVHRVAARRHLGCIDRVGIGLVVCADPSDPRRGTNAQ